MSPVVLLNRKRRLLENLQTHPLTIKYLWILVINQIYIWRERPPAIWQPNMWVDTYKPTSYHLQQPTLTPTHDIY
jgi:hypothetical protein